MTPRSLGTIGAVITTSTLALDTFSQQVITLEPELVPAENGTSAPELSRSNMYSSYSKEGQANCAYYPYPLYGALLVAAKSKLKSDSLRS